MSDVFVRGIMLLSGHGESGGFVCSSEAIGNHSHQHAQSVQIRSLNVDSNDCSLR